jgi:hypothetical protein
MALGRIGRRRNSSYTLSDPAPTPNADRGDVTQGVDFRAIREIRGTQNNGFEELCCQLAACRTVSPGSRFVRNGTPDGGVEAYWIGPDQVEHGFQAKYFFEIGNSQWRQLDESVSTALGKHPNLRHYTVCLPIDLPDARIPQKNSLRTKWDQKVKDWANEAAKRGMTVDFDLWGEHELLLELAKAENAGRTWFFFHATELSPQWLTERLAEAIAAAGPRYSSALNVTLPIASRFDALGFTDRFREHLLSRTSPLRRGLASLDDFKQRSADDAALSSAFQAASQSAAVLLGSIGKLADALPTRAESQAFKAALETAVTAANSLAAMAEERIRPPDDLTEGGKSPKPDPERDFRDTRYRVAERFATEVWAVERFAHDWSAELAGRPALLVVGRAGCGKTHLFCDVAQHRVEHGLPTILLLGEQFAADDFWGEVIKSLGLRCTRDEFFGALESAAESAGTRALIFVDAINEADQIKWDNVLPRLLESVSRRPRLGIAVSCRASYERPIVRKDLVPRQLSRIEHTGFVGRLHEALSLFCQHFGIETINAPPLDPEFENPLFLKLFCKGLHDLGLRRPPRGHHGLQFVFSQLFDAVNTKLAGELDFSADERVVYRAVDAVAEAMVDHGQYMLPKEVARSLLEQILPAKDRAYSRSLLRRLVAEGILAEDVHWQNDQEEPAHVVRFAYERLADFQLATRLLDRYHVGTDKNALSPDSEFHSLISSRLLVHFSGLLEALIVLIPERLGSELDEHIPTLQTMPEYLDAFIESLPLRDGRHITSHAIALVGRLLVDTDPNEPTDVPADKLRDSLIQMAAIPHHPLNAKWLSTRLSGVSMPERDLFWSTFLHRSWRERSWIPPSSVERFLDWAWPTRPDDVDPCFGFDDEVVFLILLTLAWFLATPNRFVRDRATKAVVCILCRRVRLARPLVESLAHVDDLYVRERLYCAIYGAVVRARDKEEIAPVADAVYESLFAAGTPPAHILLRDYGRGVIEYAIELGCAIDVDPARCRPPYHSQPLETAVPTWDELHVRYGGGDYAGLLLSLWPGMGDFASYVMGGESHGDGFFGVDRRARTDRTPRKHGAQRKTWGTAGARFPVSVGIVESSRVGLDSRPLRHFR